jgi:hypothetical protein
VLIVWLIVRHKRKQKDRRAAPLATGVSSYYGGGPGAEAYGNIARDVKEAMMMSPPATGTTKVGSERARSFVGGGSRGNDMATTGYPQEKETGGRGDVGGSRGRGMGGTAERDEKPAADVQIGYARSTNYRERKAPKLAEPPPARRKDSTPGADGATATTPRTPKYEVFPKVDPSPPPAAPVPGARGRGGAGGAGGSPPSRPRSSIQPDYNLQAWLQTTTVSPFGTLERGATNNNNNFNNNPFKTTTTNATATTTPAPALAAGPDLTSQPRTQAPKRTSDVKWPLQGSPSSEPPSRSNSKDSNPSWDTPGAVMQKEPAAVSRPVTTVASSAGGPAATRSVRVGVESMKGIGLPGVARKLPLRDS